MASTDRGRTASRAAILYDRDCGFCQSALVQVLARDEQRVLRPVALQDPEAAELLADLSPDERMASWHLVTPDGRRHSGGAAFAPLAALLPRAGALRWLAATFPGLTDRGYRLVAANRSLFGKLTRGRAGEARRYIEQRRAELA